MEIQAAILLVIVFFLMLAFSVPVSYSIIVSALVTIVAFLTLDLVCLFLRRRWSVELTAFL